MVAQKLAKIMSAILESYASQDLQHLDYLTISNTEEFRRYNFQGYGKTIYEILVKDSDQMALQLFTNA